MQDTLQPGDVLLGDACYPTYFFMAAMIDKGVALVMEQQGARRRSTDFRRGHRLAERDHLIRLDKPVRKPDWMSEQEYRLAPPSITVRECRTSRRTLVTTLCDPSIPKSELGDLYKRRWQVELDFRNIKEAMGMNVLSTLTPIICCH